MEVSMRLRSLLFLFFIAVVPLAAPSPNTATLVVSVVDQAGAAVRDAKVSVTNSATGATRTIMSAGDGATTIPGLSLTGAYDVTVSKDGFGTEERKGILLRSGETATLRVKL